MSSIRKIIVLLLLVVAVLHHSDAYAKRFKVKKVDITGNVAYTDKRLHRVMLSKPSVLFDPVFYYPQILKDDVASLELFYWRNGYLSAKVEDYSVRIDSSKYLVYVQILIKEGPLTTVEGIAIFGNKAFSDSVLMTFVPFKAGQPLRDYDVSDGTLAMLTHYADHGYLEALVTPEIRVDSLEHLAQVDYFIKENAQYFIDSTLFVGLTKTRLKVVQREMVFKRGQIVNYSKLLKSQRNLYLTGLFQSSFVKPIPPLSGKPGMKDIQFELMENKSREYNFSIGYSNVEQGRIGMALYNTNWRGTAQKLGLAVKLSFIQAGVEASFSEPWTFDTRWKTDLALGIDYLKDPAYDQKTIGGRISIGRELLHKITTNLTYRHQNVELSNVKVEDQSAEIRSQIRSLKLTFTHDTRNNLFNPTAGEYVEQSTETAGLFRAAAESFTRVKLIARYLKTITRGTVIGSGFELGVMSSPRGFDSIVLSERMYAGGPSSIRGLKYKGAGPLDENGLALGGGFMGVWNIVEIRQSIYKILGGVVFLDAGNVWRVASDASISSVRVTPGLGIRLDTALGLFRVDYGFNIKPRLGEPSEVLSFSVGQAF